MKCVELIVMKAQLPKHKPITVQHHLEKANVLKQKLFFL